VAYCDDCEDSNRDAVRERERADQLDRDNDRLHEENTGLLKEREQLGSMLAWACERLLDYWGDGLLREDIIGWWDIKRVDEEKQKVELRKQALAKLTPEECELLGVK